MCATGSGVLAAASSQVIMNALDTSARSAIAGSPMQLDAHWAAVACQVADLATPQDMLLVATCKAYITSAAM